ncbi:MAG: sulfotransferase [Planctomycetota bacterium]
MPPAEASEPTERAQPHDAPLRVAWVFSLARSGSSITAYAAADALGAAVADEVLGPWDRTGPPYGYPKPQAALAEAFKASHAALTPDIASELDSLLRTIAAEGCTDRVVCKHPHLRFTPEELAERFPDHAAVWLIRNPLKRLASIHARGWTSIIRPNHDLDFFREYAQRWLALPEERRLIFEHLASNPEAYFRNVLRAWGWPSDEAIIERAVGYQRAHYHGRSGEIEAERTHRRSLSDRSRTAPTEAVELYLRDPFMQDLFKICGWSLRKRDYLPTLAQRARRRAGAIRRRFQRGSA